MNAIEKKLIIAIGAVVLLLIAVCLIAFKAINDSVEINRQDSNAHEILKEVDSILSTPKDTESDQLYYILAGRDDALQHLRFAEEQTRRMLARFKTLTENDARHDERLAAVESAIQHKFDRIHENIMLRKNEGFQAAQVEALNAEEKLEIETMRKPLGEIADEENREFQSRLAISEKRKRNVIFSVGSLIVLILSLLILVFFMVKRNCARRRHLEQQLTELATIDELTTLYNRREINRCFKYEVDRFQRYDQPFSLLMLDIDLFKQVNDKFGHQIGDKVLQWVANRIREGIRSFDVAGRFGGEEFVVILPHTNSYDAFVIAERLRRRIADEPFKLERTGRQTIEVSITVSIGVSVIADKEETEVDVIRTADSALYKAKSDGRDRTVMFGQIDILQ